MLFAVTIASFAKCLSAVVPFGTCSTAAAAAVAAAAACELHTVKQHTHSSDVAYLRFLMYSLLRSGMAACCLRFSTNPRSGQFARLPRLPAKPTMKQNIHLNSINAARV
jgi:hypothetical protein